MANIWGIIISGLLMTTCLASIILLLIYVGGFGAFILIAIIGFILVPIAFIIFEASISKKIKNDTTTSCNQ